MLVAELFNKAGAVGAVWAILSVVNEATGPAGEGICVGVSSMRASKLYAVFGVNPLNVTDVCHAPPFIRYSQPVIVLSVMLVVVLLNIVGAGGAA